MSKELIPKPDEDPNKFKSSIERRPRRQILNIGGKAVEFTLQNSGIYVFKKQHSQFDHIYRRGDKNQGVNTWYFTEEPQFNELREQLEKVEWPLHRADYPSEKDEEMYYLFQNNKLERELDKFSKGGDL